MTDSRADYDSPWKEALERFFPAFLEFFFPEVFAGIDWSRGYEFLDTELQQITRDAESGRRLADKLVKVWRNDGTEAWLLIHVEIQGRQEADFSVRMYRYNYRIFDQYNVSVISLAVLVDSDPGWRPEQFEFAAMGFELRMRFPVAKLLDHKSEMDKLETSANPFAAVVAAHLQAMATTRDAQGRLEWKYRIVRGLYDRGWSRQDVLELLRIVDWIMTLPAELELQFTRMIGQLEEERKMSYVTSFERHGIEQGIQQGIEQGVQQGLREAVLVALTAKFAESPSRIAERLEAINDQQQLTRLLSHAVTASSLDEFERGLPLSRPA
ncbi:MAG: transposase [Chloroflexi bacterium]|nr:transposase [Chloroflexota bacterium]